MSSLSLCVSQVVATNSNDILHRFFQSGNYHRSDVTMTYSPSMDISVSSNFERLAHTHTTQAEREREKGSWAC